MLMQPVLLNKGEYSMTMELVGFVYWSVSFVAFLVLVYNLWRW